MKYFEGLEKIGEALCRYQGAGIIRCKDGKEWSCTVEVEHHIEAGVLFECVLDGWTNGFHLQECDVDSIVGVTTDGLFDIKSYGNGIVRSTSSRSGTNEVVVFCWFNGFTLNRKEASPPFLARFGITNFAFVGTEASIEKKVVIDGRTLPKIIRHRLVLPVVLHLAGQERKITFMQVEGYSEIESYLSVFKGCRVTCEAEIELSLPEEVDFKKVMTKVCNILSVARGTKIRWTYVSTYDCHDAMIDCMHFGGRPGTYSDIGPFDKSVEFRHETKRFVEVAYPKYCEWDDRLHLGGGLIERYLEAKAENDFVENRGIKLAVLVETIKAYFLRIPDNNASEFVMPRNKFSDLVKKHIKPAITTALQEAELDRDFIAEFTGKLSDLNRRTFRSILERLFSLVGYSPSVEEVGLFLKERNSIIHTGQFCEHGNEEWKTLYFAHSDNPGAPKALNITASYFFVLNFIDRFFLALLGYSGRYINRKIQSQSLKRAHNIDTLT